MTDRDGAGPDAQRVRIGQCRDVAEAAVVRAALTAHGIGVFIAGEHRALVAGLAMDVIGLDVWVDRDDAEEAAALIAELREGGAAALADDEIPADDTAPRADDETPGGAVVRSGDDTLTRLGRTRRTIAAVMVGLFLQHGTAHLSTRAWKRGIALGAVQIVGWMHLAAGNVVQGSVMVIGAVASDVIGALIEIARTSRPAASAALPPARASEARSGRASRPRSE